MLNETSARASSGNGLNTISTSVASRVVAPSAKYQVSEADDAHGVTLSPCGPLRDELGDGLAAVELDERRRVVGGHHVGEADARAARRRHAERDRTGGSPRRERR